MRDVQNAASASTKVVSIYPCSVNSVDVRKHVTNRLAEILALPVPTTTPPTDLMSQRPLATPPRFMWLSAKRHMRSDGTERLGHGRGSVAAAGVESCGERVSVKLRADEHELRAGRRRVAAVEGRT